MHPCSGNRVAVGRAVVCYTRAAHALTAGIKGQHCRSLFSRFMAEKKRKVNDKRSP